MMRWIRKVAAAPLWISFGILIISMQGVMLYRQDALTQSPQRSNIDVPKNELHLATGAHPLKGETSAQLFLIEFSDFECPYCSKFTKDVLPALDAAYIKPGRLQFYFRDFPLPLHKDAEALAEVAACADAQGQFWTTHDLLFERATTYEKYLQSTKLDVASLRDCVSKKEFADRITRDIQQGRLAGVNGTPTFFLGANDGKGGIRVNRILHGSLPLTVFKEQIDAALLALPHHS